MVHRAPVAIFAVVLVSSTHGVVAEQPSADKTALIGLHAVDASGAPVVDLKQSELSLRIGGRDRAITSLEVVRSGGAAGTTRPTAILPAPFATNETPARPTRDLLFVTDDDSFTAGKEGPVRETITQLMSTLGPTDRVGLFSAKQGGTNIDLTSDRSAIQSAVARSWGHSRSTETEDDLVCRTAVGLQVLEAVFAGYKGTAPPTVVFFSAVFGAPPVGGAAASANQGRCPLLRTEDFHKVGRAARAANANFYVVHVQDATASPLSRERIAAGVETLSGVTGAAMIRMVGSTTEAVDRITRETSAFYLVGFEPDPADRTARLLPVEMGVTRSGVRVRTRSEISLANAEPAADQKRLAPNDMLKVPTAFRDLSLRAAAFPARGDGSGKIRLVVLFEPTDPSVKLTAAAVGLYDAKGKLTRWTAEASDLARSPALGAIIVPAGTYRMRVAATDSANRSGSVDSEIVADLAPAGPMKLSGMMLGISTADGGFAPRLQFSGDSGAFGYLEIYGVGKGTNVSVVQEIAPAPDAPPIASEDTPLAAGPADDVRIAFAGFSIEPLPPGDVVLRAVISVDGNVVGRVVRTLRKTR